MIWRGIGVLAAIAVVGAVAGHVASADDDTSASGAVRVGAATLTLDPAWRRVDSATFSSGLQSMRVTLGRSGTASLVPDGVRADGAPKATRLAGYRAWSYGSVTVLPTTRGTLAIECACASAVRSVSIAGAAILAPTPDLALRLRAPEVLAALDAIRVKEHAAWTDSSAQHLAAAHRAALDALRPVASAPLTRALSDAALAYDSLAQAAPATGDEAARAAAAGVEADGDGAQAAAASAGGAPPATVTGAARDDVAAADRALDGVVASLAREGAPKVQSPPAATVAATDGGGVPLPTLLVLLLIALAVSVLAPAGLRRLRRYAPEDERLVTEDEHAEAESPAGKACLLTAHRRKPIAPPPTFGRWNEPPRGPGAAPEDGARDSAMASSSTT